MRRVAMEGAMRGALALVIALSNGAALAQTRLSGDHPILGTWVFDVPQRSCSETHYIRADGTSLVTSGDEVAESQFTISAAASPKGYYRMVDTIVKDNGKPDCLGQLTAVGTQSTLFVHFIPARDIFIMCQAESLKACIGPWRRVHGDDL